MECSRRRFMIYGGLLLGGMTAASIPYWWPAQARFDRPLLSFSQPPELPNESHQAGVAEFSLRAGYAAISLPGLSSMPAQLMTYNRSFPGPTLRVRAGDRVRIRLQNDLNEPTNLHFHGLHISPTGIADNIFRSFPPGETSLIEFTVPSNLEGTYWYHPHRHGYTNTQVFAGLSGSLIVEGTDLPDELRSLPESIVVLKDLDLNDQGEIPPLLPMDWMLGREGPIVLVNGVVQPHLQTQAPTLRLRLLNQSVGRYYQLHLEGHVFWVIATDGRYVNQPYSAETLLLAPGERYDVLVNFQQSGSFTLVNQPYDRGSMHRMGGRWGMGRMHSGRFFRPSTASPVIMTLEFVGTPQAITLPSRLNALPLLQPQDAIQKRVITFTGQRMMAGFSFNNQPFEPNRVDLRAKLGTIELWELVNRTAMDHPFHLHVYGFQVNSRAGVLASQAMWKDVVNVRAGETVQILVPFQDFLGKTVYHCHLLEHEEKGMMGIIEVA